MKATVDIPDALYRRVKAKCAIEGRSVREVAVECFASYVERDNEAVAADTRLPGEAIGLPSWFGLAQKRVKGKAAHDWTKIRRGIENGWAENTSAQESVESVVKRR